MKNDLAFGIVLSEGLPFHQPFLCLGQISILGPSHSNRIHQLEQLSFSERSKSMRLDCLFTEDFVLLGERADLFSDFESLGSCLTTFMHKIY